MRFILAIFTLASYSKNSKMINERNSSKMGVEGIDNNDIEKLKKNEQMKEINKRLNILISNDKKSWVEVYELMDLVDREKLYEGVYRSYTTWVNCLAANNHVHVSTLWNRKKAGKVYAEYLQRVEKQGKCVAALSELKLSPDTLNLISKIAGSNTEVADALIGKATTDGGITRSELRTAWATVRANRDTVVRKTRHDKKVKVPEEALTAGDIVVALTQNHDWIPDHVWKEIHQEEKYKLFTEFAVQSGSSRNARRIDALVLENFSELDKRYHLCIHAIEIKVSRSDLNKDEKMQEYCEFADCFWIAVPEELEEDAKKIMIEGWGLLVIKIKNATMHIIDEQSSEQSQKTEIRVAIKAKKNPGLFRDKTIETALIKII